MLNNTQAVTGYTNIANYVTIGKNRLALPQQEHPYLMNTWVQPSGKVQPRSTKRYNQNKSVKLRPQPASQDQVFQTIDPISVKGYISKNYVARPQTRGSSKLT